MKFLLTIINDETVGMGDPTPEQMAEAMEPWNQINREMLDADAFVAGDALHPSAAATTVRFGDGDQTVTDGPFAETKEQLGGYYVLECADLDEALAWAKKLPIRPGNAVEVSPAIDFTGFGYLDPYAEVAKAS